VPEGARHLSGDRDDLDWFIPAVQREHFDAAIDFISFFPAQAKASLEAFRGVGHFIHTSTVVTFGEEFDWLPVTEDHPLRPTIEYGRNKAAIERFYQAAFFAEDFPVTIIKPSTTYGRRRVVRQVGIDTRWIARIRQGRPILKVGDGNAIHHLLHVDDAALGFVGALEHEHCIGQTYLLVNPEHTNWVDVHKTAMEILGREVDQVSVSADTLFEFDPARFALVKGVFSRNLLYSAAKIQRDVPEFRPTISFRDGLADAFEYLESNGLVEDVPLGDWEDDIIAVQVAARQQILSR
jgi:nucleoside-diphosphate-sugar epimerase